MAESKCIKFYGDLLSPSCRAVVIFFKANNIPYSDMQSVACRKGGALVEANPKVNLVHLSPAIDDDGFVLAGSEAILKYVHSRFELSDAWYPRDVYQRARVDELLAWNGYHVHTAATNIFIRQILEPKMKNITVDHERLWRHQVELNRALDWMEESFLVDFPFVAGENLTIADLVVACELAQAATAGHNVGHCRPAIAGWFDRVRDRLQPHFDNVGLVLKNGGKVTHGRVYQCESFDT